MTAPFSAPHFAISLYCSDFRNPAPQVEYLNTVADSYHVDIMDGHFSPSMGLCTSWIEQMLPLSTLRNEVHMMVTDPDHWIDQLVVAGATMLTPHVESLGAHAFRTLVIESARVQNLMRRGFAAAFAGLGINLALSDR